MPHVKVIDGQPVQYPYTERQLRMDYPNTSFPKPTPNSTSESYGRHPVTVLVQPSYKQNTQRVLQNSLPHFDGEKWVIGWNVVDIPLEEAKDNLLELLANKRWEVEHGGTTFNGGPLPTDEKTRSVLTAAYVKAKEDPNYTIQNWKHGKGSFGPLDSSTIIALSDAIEIHVQSCFDKEAELSSEITQATTAEELNLVDINSGWE